VLSNPSDERVYAPHHGRAGAHVPTCRGYACAHAPDWIP